MERCALEDRSGQHLGTGSGTDAAFGGLQRRERRRQRVCSPSCRGTDNLDADDASGDLGSTGRVRVEVATVVDPTVDLTDDQV